MKFDIGIVLSIKVITYFYPVNYVTYNTLCFILPEISNRAVNLMKKIIFKEIYDYSLFAENGVIVRNLNYRPWQWVIAFPVAKVFLAVFNKLIE